MYISLPKTALRYRHPYCYVEVFLLAEAEHGEAPSAEVKVIRLMAYSTGYMP